MSHTLMLAPTGLGAGLTTAVNGLFHAMDRQGINVHFFKPIAQPTAADEGCDRSIAMLQPSCKATIAEPIDIREAEHYVSEGRGEQLLEEIVARFEQTRPADADVVIIEGMVPTHNQPYATRINKQIAKALDAEVVLVAAPGNDTPEALEDHIDITARAFGGIHNRKVLGCLLTKLGAPVDCDGRPCWEATSDNPMSFSLTEDVVREHCTVFGPHFQLIGGITWSTPLNSPRVSDIADYLKARAINAGEMDTRRVSRIRLCARTVGNILPELKAGTMILTSGDRDDIILAVCLAALNGLDLAALVLTGDYEPNEGIMKLCHDARASGLPILSVSTDSWQTALSLPRFSQEVPLDDIERIEQLRENSAAHIDTQWLQRFSAPNRERRLSPPAFRYQLIERARQANKRIVLPEGEEPRTIRAAVICAERGIAHCTLLGNREEIERIAKGHGITLGPGVEVFEPEQIREHYVARLVELRSHKGMTAIIADQQLEDNVVLGTMMLEMGHVDGLVSGAVHTTANTIRPPLQLIKTAPGTNLVSSIFFMCLPDQVLVYGDCAINPDPNAEQLADIAIQSADSAKAFGIPPRVAMISYSTGGSGAGADVDKVREATRIAREKRPDLLIDGPLQYDAAIMENVARSKAPDSSVAGKATVFIFPDLNTGNTTYKAVQRSADVISIGPMLQGMNKPVNDLSRGALVDDIVFTIALTAIQAGS
ncbi:phosphate acetyltransferase [Sessilibacter corallicola]|uniref:Phosphate acetyltransferase n=1 Tax=Sessilibacter corallicola TaxID=2904075 RepID=A0ABQ0AFF1_9GAMM|nr:phosphate acetyltransferase [Sessilibacter corallicola]